MHAVVNKTITISRKSNNLPLTLVTTITLQSVMQLHCNYILNKGLKSVEFEKVTLLKYYQSNAVSLSKAYANKSDNANYYLFSKVINAKTISNSTYIDTDNI